MTKRAHPTNTHTGNIAQGDHGAAALLAVLLIGGALSSAVALTATSIADSARELRIRKDVLCAGYAAAGGLAIGRAANGRPELVSPSVSQLEVYRLLRNADWCVLHATARCNGAVRSRERTIDCTP